ncbi:MAG TPA: PAS domain S-box protein [Nitrospirae bacterium]|nr:PAS domain S-box protein [Nitrospirota bacterium]
MARLRYKTFRGNESYVHAVVDNALDAIITINEKGFIESFNPAAQRIFGYSLEEALGANISLLMPEPYGSQHDGYIKKYLKTGKSRFLGVPREVLAMRKNGTIFTAEISASEMRVGSQRRFVGVMRDITDRKQAEEKLRNAHLEIERLFSAISEILIGVDSEQRITRWNKAAEETFGISEMDVLGKLFTECGVKWDWERALALSGECMRKSGGARSAELAYQKPGGEHSYLRITISPVITEPGKLNGFLLHGNDITEQKKSEAELSLASTVYEYALDGIIVTDGDAVIRSVNPAFTKITGYTAKETVGENPRILKSGRQGEDFYQQMWASLKEKGQWKGEIWNKRKNGEVYPEWLAITAIKDVSGKTVKYISVFRDTTEIKRAEEELLKQSERLSQAEKLAAIGELASGVAHELNQPLNHINITCQLLNKIAEKKKIDKPGLLEEVKVISENVERAVEIIKNLRDFARKESSEIYPVNVGKAIRNSIKMFGSQLKVRNISLTVEIPSGRVMVIGAANRLSQVMINLIANARDALDTIEDDRQKKILIEVEDSADEAVIRVKDTGPGIADSIKKEIFNPFFTTKPPGKGTGIGLSIVYKIIQEFGGKLEVESQEGSGATMIITLLKPPEASNG